MKILLTGANGFVGNRIKNTYEKDVVASPSLRNVSEDDVKRIVEESGADDETKEYLIEKLKAPMETEALIAEAQGNIELAAKLYSASLIPIEANANERAYLAHLAAGMGLDQQTAASIEEIMGVKA